MPDRRTIIDSMSDWEIQAFAAIGGEHLLNRVQRVRLQQLARMRRDERTERKQETAAPAAA